MNNSEFIPADPEAHIWDVVVVGTGAGGGTAGFNFAKRGHSVLFLERGTGLTPVGPPVASTSIANISGTIHSSAQNFGRAAKIHSTDPAPTSLTIASGIGGSTSVFGMVMDRFRPVDFQLGATIRLPHGTSAPASWPIQYDDLQSYYREAEVLYRVAGADDPLTPTHTCFRTPVTPSQEDTFVHDALTQCGLHPYPIHYAREYAPGCTGCVGTLCPHECRNDTARICVLPALTNHGAKYLPDCTVIRLEECRRTVHSATCDHHGRRIAIRGRLFVLALNALLTPALLLRSCNSSFPQGLGNHSGNVGRHLMLHVSDSLLVRFRMNHDVTNNALRLGASLNDFYTIKGLKLGNIHAHAVALPPLDDSRVLFNTIVEDFPYADNLVTPKPGTDSEVTWEYRYRPELRARSAILRRKFARAVARACDVAPHTPVGPLNPTHMCGTCRFGIDPTSSVLDKYNRVHDLDNVYVLDGSFFPTSSGINPSLTIVANSLRVSTHLANQC